MPGTYWWDYAVEALRGFCRYSSPAMTHELASLGSAKNVKRVTVSFSDLIHLIFTKRFNMSLNFNRNSSQTESNTIDKTVCITSYHSKLIV